MAVVIACHNYGRYLEEAVLSVLNQTRPVDEILIVDDSSTDDTPAVAKRLATECNHLAPRDESVDLHAPAQLQTTIRPIGIATAHRESFAPSSILHPRSSTSPVRYIRVEHRHSQRTRRSGFNATRSDVVCFLDADDCLSPNYIHDGMEEFAQPNVGIVYSDVEHFGAAHAKSRYPAHLDRAALARMNYMHSGSLVLREALDISQGLEIDTDDKLALQDWLLWRRILDHGWTARKQRGLYLYRKHGESMTARWPAWGDDPHEYFHRAALATETITLFVPLSGRAALWPKMAGFLDRQTWPHRQIRLVLMDTSQNPEFSRVIRQWIAECDYADVHHLCQSVGDFGLADKPRRTAKVDVCLAMARIYNRMGQAVSTDYVWVVEDDILPPPDACGQLMRGFDRQTASVSGAYRSRFADCFVVFEPDGRMQSRKGTGLRTTGGNGFGCVVLRSELVRNVPFTATIDIAGFDGAFYRRLPLTGLKAKVDWSVECEHVEAGILPLARNVTE